MNILRLLSAGIIATSLAGAAQADTLNYSFNSATYDPFNVDADTFTANFQSSGNTFFILTYGFSGGTQADGTSVTGGGFDSKLSILDTAFSNEYAFNDPDCIQNAVAFAGLPVSHNAASDPGSSVDACLEIQVGTGVNELLANTVYTLELSAINGIVPFERTNKSWAFDILGVQFASIDPISEVPAPGLIGLFGVMFAGLSVRRAKRLAAR